MVKNFEGRKVFLNTIELDINRAESYGKRLQRVFEREYETVGLCQNILSASIEDVTSNENIHIHSNDTTSDKYDDFDSDEKCNDTDNKIDMISMLNTSFNISTCQNHWGI